MKSLKSEEFIRDIHIPSLIVFPPGKDFHDHPLYKSGEIILQDKVRCYFSLLLLEMLENRKDFDATKSDMLK